MKLNTKRTVLVGLAFLSICAFWQMYDNRDPQDPHGNLPHGRKRFRRRSWRRTISSPCSCCRCSADCPINAPPALGRRTSLYSVRHPRGRRGDDGAAHSRPTASTLRPDAWKQVCFIIGAGNPADRHGYLPQPRRGADARRHPQAPALQGQRHHQPDGRPGRHHLPGHYHISVSQNKPRTGARFNYLPLFAIVGGHHAGRPCRRSAAAVGRAEAGGGESGAVRTRTPSDNLAQVDGQRP